MFKYALDLVLRRKMRTLLTSLGITIAVFLITFIIFGMQSLQSLLVDQFNNVLKPNQVIVAKDNPLGSFLPSDQTYDQTTKKPVVMNDKVINEIKNLGYVQNVSRLTVITGLQATVVEKKVPFSNAIMAGWDVKSDNSYFTDFYGDAKEPGNGSVFVSTSLAKYYKATPEELIGKELVIEPTSASIFSSKSKSIIGKKFTYTISGVFTPGQDKNDVVLSIDDSVNILSSIGGFSSSADYIKEIGYDNLYVTVNNDSVKEFKKYVKDKYNYGTYTADDVISILSSITKGLTIALVMFGLVSAVVAGIGIVNTMIMSIYEQTKEIGIIKAIGASNMQVLVIFLIQSGVIGLIGGVFGLGSVLLVMKIADPIIVTQLEAANFTATHFFNFDPSIALLITGISILVGVVAGIYPAIRAARLDPIKALRYE